LLVREGGEGRKPGISRKTQYPEGRGIIDPSWKCGREKLWPERDAVRSKTERNKSQLKKIISTLL